MGEGDALTIRVKIGSCELEVSGKKEDVIEVFGGIEETVARVSAAFAAEQPQAQQEEAEEPPHIQLTRGIQAPDAIVKILSTPWGDKPRTLTEMLNTLRINAIHFPKGTVAGRLTDLTKRGVLRRVETAKGFGYVLVKTTGSVETAEAEAEA